MRKLKAWLSSRWISTICAILIQFFLLGTFFLFLDRTFEIAHIVLVLISVVAVFHLLSRNMNGSLKRMCCILILMFPWIGGIFYFLFGKKKTHPASYRCVVNSSYLPKVLRYALSCAYGQLCDHTQSIYFKSAEAFRESYLKELSKAVHVIYMEYFILAEGQFFSEILDILVDRMNHGVQVYLMIDDIGCIRTLPDGFEKKMQKLGIHIHIYNPLKRVLSLNGNTRDHRKITVIDNHCAFMGGNNLADEYINNIKKFGYWKDAAVMVKGQAAAWCAQLFESFWNHHAPEPIHNDCPISSVQYESDGWVVPFVDDALDEELSALNIHLFMIESAHSFIQIQTPYLILKDEMKHALMRAAKSGVQVQLLLPHVPDRWFVHEVSRSYYKELIQSGVRIFEYVPGFNHSKVVLNDEIGLCSTINMDYRSYVHHHECGILFYQSSVLDQMREDMRKTIEQSVEIHLEDCEKISMFVKVFRTFMSLWEPLL